MSESKDSTPNLFLRHGGWLVFAVALILRLIYMLEASDSPYFASPILDAARYDSMAQEIAAGNWIGDEVFFQGPLYSYFLAVLYALLGHNYIVSRLVQIILSALTALLVHQIAKRHLNLSSSFTAGFICALYGPL
ncbi:glycosyltransferase family 39 protein, partial [bacterium]|nr:glycosyltransferase family 39 protein [bacterium]